MSTSLDPVSTNITSKNCAQAIGSDCVTLSTQLPGVSLCAGSSITDALMQLSTLISSLSGQQGITYQQLLAALSGALDLSSINLGCLYQPTIQTWTCPVGQSFRADSTALTINGTLGFCVVCPTPSTCVVTPIAPVLSSIPNPTPPPTTLPGIIQLMIDTFCQCYPCTKSQI